MSKVGFVCVEKYPYKVPLPVFNSKKSGAPELVMTSAIIGLALSVQSLTVRPAIPSTFARRSQLGVHMAWIADGDDRRLSTRRGGNKESAANGPMSFMMGLPLAGEYREPINRMVICDRRLSL